jgi:hypothetical protein
MEVARSVRLARSVPAALISIPILWGIVAHALGSAPRPMAAAPRKPALAFAQRLVDLGLVSPREEVPAYFDFTNRGKETVTIKELVPSCGCLQPELRKKTYRPGESGHFVLRVQTANQVAGDKEYKVAVHYEDPQPQVAEVVFRVKLPENQVFIRPRVLEVHLASQSHTQEIEIIDRRDAPLKIVKAECPRSQIVRVRPGELTMDENGHVHHHLTATIFPSPGEGTINTVIRIFTDDPEYKSLRVPLKIHMPKELPLANGQKTIVDPQVRPASAEN